MQVKFGAPHVVDFGPELQNSPDGKMYIIGHGAVLPEVGQYVLSSTCLFLMIAIV